MYDTNLVRLDLRSPLRYVKCPDLKPFEYGTLHSENETPELDRRGCEQLFCFELDPEQSVSIEPDRKRLVGALLFSGYRQERAEAEAGAETVSLPAGVYLFAQRREALGKESCVDMAIEQQKDGLWERNVLQNLLYIRYLFEDGKPVTQFFRPLKSC